MKELVTRAQVDTAIRVIAALGLIGAPVAGWIARRRGENQVKYALGIGGPLLLIAVMWHIYNAIEDKLGLDSVAALAINFGIFVVLGAAIGVGWTLYYDRPSAALPQADAPAVGPAVE